MFGFSFEIYVMSLICKLRIKFDTERLPFKMQSKFTEVGKKLIDEVKVVDISEWNTDPEFGMYPLRPVASNDT